MRSLSVVIASAVLVVSVPVAALGATTSIADPAGDGQKGDRLDITGATLDNKAKALKIRVDFAKVAKGDLIVFVKLEDHQGYFRAVSEYRPKEGTVDNYLLGGADPEQTRKCPGFTAAWSTSDNVASLRIPARCLDGGDYDKAKFKVLTEIGSDVDLAPTVMTSDAFPYSKYAARG
jgi:hypothetical protein